MIETMKNENMTIELKENKYQNNKAKLHGK